MIVSHNDHRQSDGSIKKKEVGRGCTTVLLKVPQLPPMKADDDAFDSSLQSSTCCYFADHCL